MTLVTLRQAIIDSIEANIPAFKSVQAHGGSFNLPELERVSMKSPTCLVAIMGGVIERQTTVAVATPAIYAFVVTRGTSQEKRDEAALVLAEAVATMVINNEWDVECTQAPTGVRMENLYSGKIDAKGVALWVVNWSQKSDLAGLDTSAFPYLHTIAADYDLAPVDGVIDFEQLIQLGGEPMSVYGQLYVSTAVATAIAVPDTYQKVAGTTTLKLNDGVDMPENMRLRHTGTVAKPFQVRSPISVEVASNSKVTFALAKNGVVDANTEVEQDIVALAGAEAFSVDGLFSLDANDYIELWVKCDLAINVTVTKGNILLGAT